MNRHAPVKYAPIAVSDESTVVAEYTPADVRETRY